MGYRIDSLDICFGTQLARHWGNLCIGVDARSCVCFSGRNLGALFEVLCVELNIMNLYLLWCYFSTNSWLVRSERIAWCYFSTNSRID